MKKSVIRIMMCCIVLSLVGVFSVFLINAYMKYSCEKKIINIEEAKELEDVDCILVLGCYVINDGNPSSMLADRLDTGIELYGQKVAGKIIMSGDHGKKEYNEVATMKKYAVDNGVLTEDVFMDHAGFSTYESIYRAKEIFGADNIVIVSQKYHLYRAVHIAKSLGMTVHGVACVDNEYPGQDERDIREVLARVKDFGTSIIKPKPKYLGENISLQGTGDVTNDEAYRVILE